MGQHWPTWARMSLDQQLNHRESERVDSVVPCSARRSVWIWSQGPRYWASPWRRRRCQWGKWWCPGARRRRCHSWPQYLERKKWHRDFFSIQKRDLIGIRLGSNWGCLMIFASSGRMLFLLLLFYVFLKKKTPADSWVDGLALQKDSSSHWTVKTNTYVKPAPTQYYGKKKTCKVVPPQFQVGSGSSTKIN